MTHPTPPTGPPGVRDYEAAIPVTRTNDDGGQAGHLRVRIPAGSPAAAGILALGIAEHLQTVVHDTAGAEGWDLNEGGIVVTDVDDTQSAAEVEAERDYLRRTLAALAAKLPMMLMLTGDEYAAADPSDLRTMQLGPAVVFFTPRAYGAATPAEPAGPAPDLMPLASLPPAGHGGHTDPDVRNAHSAFLARFQPDQVEVLIGGQWLRLVSATIDHVQGSVHLDLRRHDPVDVPGHMLIVTRPATMDSYAEDLPIAASMGSQMLTSDGWWTLTAAEFMGDTAGCFKVHLARGDEQLSTSITRGHPVLVRTAAMPAGWSR